CLVQSAAVHQRTPNNCKVVEKCVVCGWCCGIGVEILKGSRCEFVPRQRRIANVSFMQSIKSSIHRLTKSTDDYFSSSDHDYALHRLLSVCQCDKCSMLRVFASAAR